MAEQRLSQWVALRCKEDAFQRFLGVQDECTAIHEVRALCDVKSRREFDRDKEAAARFHEIIRKPFIDFSHDQEQHQ